MTYTYQIINDDQAIFFNGLNWSCRSEWSYLVDNSADKKVTEFEKGNCANRGSVSNK